MSFKLNHIVPCGRSFDAYVAKLALPEADLQGIIPGCDDGPAFFNASLTKMSGLGRVLSMPLLYRYSPDAFRNRDQHDLLRILPLRELGAEIGCHLHNVATKSLVLGYNMTIVQIDYEFQRGGNQMMTVIRIQ